MEWERREYQFDISTGDGERGKVITGRPIVYGVRTNIGYIDEIIAKGALDGADMRDVRFLVNHDKKMIPLARSRRNNGNSTMQLMTVDDGLDISVTLDVDNNSTAAELYSAIEREDISGMSFAFLVRDEKWEDLDSDHPTRTILKFEKIIEVSAVTFPAYEQTSISVRNNDDMSEKILREARERNRIYGKDVEVERLRIEINAKRFL